MRETHLGRPPILYRRRPLAGLFVVAALGCAAQDGPFDAGDTAAQDTQAADESSSGGSPLDGSETSSVPPPGSASADGDSTSADDGADTSGDTGPPAAEPFATTMFTIPAGTVVQEFSFAATADTAPGLLDGRTMVVAITDVTHPDRDQSVLCPGNHPLDGCATVDYGAFGMPHDNRITLQATDGPLTVHLYKDRSLEVDPEPLPVNE